MHFLGKLFTPKERVWMHYCDDIGGRYLEGGFWNGDRIEIPHRGWTITLVADTGDAESNFVSTSLRAEVHAVDTPLVLWLVRNWPGQKLMNLVRMVGLRKAAVSGLSYDCMVLANDTGQARTVFGNAQVRALINEQPELCLDIGIHPGSSRSAANATVVMVPGVVKDLARLKSLVALCRQVIDTLSELGLILHAKAS